MKSRREASTSTARVHTAGPPDAKRWLAFVILVLAAFMDLLDNTIVAVALPSIQRDLGATYAALQWMSAGYGLAFAAVLITGGRLGDVVGRKRVFLIGIVGFTVASLLSGLATQPGMLVGSRVLQGAMAGIMVPQMLSVIAVSFPRQELPKAFGIWGAVSGLAAISGPVLAGVLLKADIAGLGWRPIFLINIPIGVLTFVGALALVRESKSPTPLRLDLVGALLATATLLLLTVPLVQGRELGWPAWSVVALVAVVPVLALFVVYERGKSRRGDSPLVDTRLFGRRAFVGGLLMTLVFYAAIPAFFLMFVIYLQVGLGFTPLHAGLTGLPFSFGAAASAGASIRLSPKLGRRLQVSGSLFLIAGMSLVTFLAFHSGSRLTSVELIPALLLAGLGMGQVLPPLINLVLSGIPPRDAGSASGVLTTSQQVGAAMGVALMGLVFFGLLGSYGASVGDRAVPAVRAELTQAGVPADRQDQVAAAVRACVADRTAKTDPGAVPASCRRVEALVPPASVNRVDALISAEEKASHLGTFTKSFQRSMFLVIGLFTLSLVITRLLPARRTAPPVPVSPAPAEAHAG